MLTVKESFSSKAEQGSSLLALILYTLKTPAHIYA